MTPDTVVFGRYRLHEQIGAGGAGTVWRATDELLLQTIALKRVIITGLDDDQAKLTRDRALREARLAAQLRGHPHVVAVYDILLDDTDIWLVMEYLPAHSLREHLHNHTRLTPTETARIGTAIADALAAAHDRGIEHRDVKPGNILLGADNTVKLTDFGISHLTGDPQLTHTGITATPAYLAPEVATHGETSPASDIFSLGSTLYAALEGQPPFGLDDNTIRMLKTVSTGIIRPPSHAGPLEPLLLRLLHINPTTRPDAGTTRDLLAQLTSPATKVLKQLPTPPGRLTSTSQPPQPTRRRIAITAAALLVVTTIGVLAGVWLLSGSTGEALSPVATRAGLPAGSPGLKSPAGVVLADGGFEAPRVPSFTVVTVVAGRSVGAWTVTRGEVDHIGPGFWQASEGSQSVDLSGLVDGAVAQTFNTTPGVTYIVEFFLAGNPDGPPGVKVGRAMVDGQTVKDFSIDSTANTLEDMGYQKMNLSFTAHRSQSTVEFTSTSNSPWGPVIDNVTVRTAPTKFQR